MQKVDWIIAGLGVVAIAATVLGVTFEDELVGSQEVTFPTFEQEVMMQEGVSLTSPYRDSWTVARNATAVRLDVTVRHTGTAYNPEDGSVRVEFTGPNGTTYSETKPLTCGSCPNAEGAQMASLTFGFDWKVFHPTPGTLTVEDPSALDANKTWLDDYKLTITVTAPSDVSFMGVGASHTYVADIEIRERYFQHALKTPADPSNI